MSYGIDGAALDRYITGNYGEDSIGPCDDCEDYDECQFDYDHVACKDAAKADALMDAREVE